MGAIFNWVASWQALERRNIEGISLNQPRSGIGCDSEKETRIEGKDEAITWNVTKLINSTEYDSRLVSSPPRSLPTFIDDKEF